MKHYKCRLLLLFVFFQCSHLAIAKVPLFGFNNSEEEVLNIDHFEQALTRLVYLDSIQEIDSLIQYIPKAKALCGRIKDRKSTRLNSSHVRISYAVFCLKKKII